MKHETHEFALFLKNLEQYSSQKKQVTLTEPEIVHRIKNVLRLNLGEVITFFSQTHQAQAKLLSIEKRHILVDLAEMQKLEPLTPSIHWLLPLLDREAYEHSLEQLTVMGAASITPVITAKSRKKPATDEERAQRLLISAAEQSKQFVLPCYKKTTTLEDTLTNLPHNTLVLFCHPDGIQAQKAIEKLRAEKPINLICLMGPEGDFTKEERVLLQKAGGLSIALTKTVLRSETALTVFLGILRSFI